MRPSRGNVLLLAVILTRVLSPSGSVAAEPRAIDVSSTARGQRLVAEARDEFAQQGHSYKKSDLRAMQSPDGTITILPAALTDSLVVAAAPRVDGSIQYSTFVNVGLQAANQTVAEDRPLAQSAVVAAAAAYWSVRETACFRSFYVDSARLDVCYRISKLINDNNTSRSYWALEVGGTAFETDKGLRSAFVSGERTPGSVTQRWEFGWQPASSITRNCTDYFVGVTHIVSIGQTFQVCEKWTMTKSANESSPYLKFEWGCNAFLCQIVKDDRDVAEAYQVSVGQTQTPLFRLGYGMAA
jgi:hypothetical protein